MIVHTVAKAEVASTLHQLQGEIDGTRRDKDPQGGTEDLGTCRHLPQRIDSYEPCYRLDDNKVELIAQRTRRDEDGDEMGDERRARVQEDSHKDRSHGKRQHIDGEVEVTVLHHQGDADRKDGYQGVEHGHATRLREIVATEERQVQRKKEDKGKDIERIAYKMTRDLRLADLAPLHLFLHRVEHYGSCIRPPCRPAR